MRSNTERNISKRKNSHRHEGHHSHKAHGCHPRKKIFLSTAVICLCGAIILVFLLYQAQKRQRDFQVSAENSHDTGSGYRDITYEDKHYRYNALVKTVLYAGVDSTGKLEETPQYGNKARADSISLVVMDAKHKKMTIVPINRDTMTEIQRYSMNGNDNGLYTTHLGYAYSYGNGGKVSCENLCEAVSNLFYGIPVREYVITNQDSMPYINDLAGGIKLTVPNDDLKDEFPELSKGAEVTLNENNIRSFLQYRDTEKDFSNEGRMERQKAYVTAYIEKVQGMNSKDIINAWEALEDMEDYLQTNITKNKYLDFADLIKKVDFSENSFGTIEGEDKAGELHDEFYPDKEALMKLVIELFYEEV